MRRLSLSLFALLLAAPTLGAAEARPVEVAVPEVVASIVAKDEPTVHGEVQLTEVEIEARAASDEEASAAQLGERGSFWWLVGVIVVAGVILAVVL